jgi:NO-binding membrane sensor protein with MHYT domain
VLAILIVGAGLFTIGFAPRTPTVLLVSGGVTGIGVAAMHYTGMAALHVDGSIHYDLLVVLASVAIAMVACTAALWAALYVRGTWAMSGAALVMGAAVSGMHYTGMAAATALLGSGNVTPPGLQAEDYLLPMIVGVSALTVVVLFIVMLSPNEAEIIEERDRAHRRAAALRTSPPDRTIFDKT